MNAFPAISRIVVAGAALLASLVSSLHADTRDDIQALREQIRQLDQKLRALELKQQVQDEQASAAKSAPKVSLTDKGYAISSGDGANLIKFRTLVQLDSRLFFNDGGLVNNSFVLRRARLISEGTFATIYSFQLVPEFGGTGAPSILDANFGVALSKALQFRFGRLKSPVGLELIQSDAGTFFAERSLATNLVPNRDLGVLASGSILGDSVIYSAGILGGVADGASSTNADFDNDKDLVARAYATPFKSRTDSPLQGLSVGVSGTLGRQKSASGRTAGYKTDGQQTFFSYLPTVVADGRTWRVSPQGDYRCGPFGLLGEYVLSTVNVRPGATGAKAELRNKAWQLAAGWVLTGEDSSFSGVTPKTDFNPAAGTWGAFEIAARYANLKIDDAAFPLFASTSSNADEASSVGFGLNWYLSKVVLLKFDYHQTKFDFAPFAPATPAAVLLRQDEKAFISRFQIAF